MTARYALRFASLGYLAVLLVAPVGFVFWRTFEHGVGPAWDAVTTSEALHALKVTLILTAIAVPANTIFGVLCALAIVRHRYPGAGIVNAVVDLPLALSPVVVGLALLLLYGRGGWLGGHHVVFALPGMALDHLRLAAVCRAGGRPRAARDRDGAGTGGRDARSVRLADVRARHVACHPLG